MPLQKDHEHGFDGDYARDTHRGGLSDNYAREGAWSGAGRADDHVRESHDDHEGVIDQDDASIGKASE